MATDYTPPTPVQARALLARLEAASYAIVETFCGFDRDDLIAMDWRTGREKLAEAYATDGPAAIANGQGRYSLRG